jgi:hypothetical protein
MNQQQAWSLPHIQQVPTLIANGDESTARVIGPIAPATRPTDLAAHSASGGAAGALHRPARH